MSDECREEVAVVHIEPLTQTLLAYLRKHVRLLSFPLLSSSLLSALRSTVLCPLVCPPVFPASRLMLDTLICFALISCALVRVLVLLVLSLLFSDSQFSPEPLANHTYCTSLLYKNFFFFFIGLPPPLIFFISIRPLALLTIYLHNKSFKQFQQQPEGSCGSE